MMQHTPQSQSLTLFPCFEGGAVTPNRIILADVVGSGFCVSSEDGSAVYRRIADSFDRRQPVELSFAGVTRLTSAFLNSAVGQLYNEYDEQTVRGMIIPVDASRDQLILLKKVVDNAKMFFANPTRHKEALKDVLDDDE